MITKEEFEKAVEHCNHTTFCEGCPLCDKLQKCGVYLTEYIKNEPAPAAAGTSSEVSQKEDTTSLAHLDDSTKEQICQAYKTAVEACLNILTVYKGMSECEQKAFDIGEAYVKIFDTRCKLEELRGEQSD